MKELSVFIDESGDFGEITEQPAYYLVTLLFHDQKNENRLSRSEKQFFYKPQELKKTFSRTVDKKRLRK